MNIYWKNATTGLFTDPNNWVQGVVPGAGDIAELTSTCATAIVSAASPVTVLGVNIGSKRTCLTLFARTRDAARRSIHRDREKLRLTLYTKLCAVAQPLKVRACGHASKC
jgi:hypothetical protein